MTHVSTTSRGRFVAGAAAASAATFGFPAIIKAQNKAIVIGINAKTSCAPTIWQSTKSIKPAASWA